MENKREPKTVNEIFAENLAASGYANEDKLKTILNKLLTEEIEELVYASYRACEKIGEDAFECHCLPDEEDYYENILKDFEPSREIIGIPPTIHALDPSIYERYENLVLNLNNMRFKKHEDNNK